MSTPKILTWSLSLVLILVRPVTAYGALSETFSIPVNGSMTMGFSLESQRYGDPGVYTSLGLTFGNLTETATYDPVQNTLRQVGFIPVNPATWQFQLVQNGILGTGTISMGMAGGGIFIDTGDKPVFWSPWSESFAVDSSVWDFNGPSYNGRFVGSYSLVVEDNTYSGSFEFGLSRSAAQKGTHGRFLWRIDATQDPNNVLLSGLGGDIYYTGGDSSIDIADASGFEVRIRLPVSVTLDWSSDPALLSLPIPETGTCLAGALLLLPFGAYMLRGLRKR